MCMRAFENGQRHFAHSMVQCACVSAHHMSLFWVHASVCASVGVGAPLWRDDAGHMERASISSLSHLM